MSVLEALVLYDCVYQENKKRVLKNTLCSRNWSRSVCLLVFFFKNLSITFVFPRANRVNYSSGLNELGIEVKRKCHQVEYPGVILKVNEAKPDKLWRCIKW